MKKVEIKLWYGEEQTFGKPGVSQVWANIHGNITNHHNLYNLVYTLNGKKRSPLTTGPSAYRLLAPGDFNIEIDRKLLNEGINSVTISAKDISGNVDEKEVKIYCDHEQTCQLPYYIDWSQASKIQDVAHIVDGKWSLDKVGVRPLEIGYDRLIAIGDMSWTDYETIVPITILRFNTDQLCFDLPSAGPGVGIMLRWKGHYNLNDIMPRNGYRPFGAIGWYRYGNEKSAISGDYSLEILKGTEKALQKKRDQSGKKLIEGKTYIFKFRVESRKENTSLYRLKVWEQGEKEPNTWDLEAEGLEGELDRGSILFVAHHCDAIFGNTLILAINKTQ